jgi:putative ABC transport system permease protein
MKSEPRRRLLMLSLREDTRALVSSVFGISMGIAALVFFVALGLGVGRVVQEKVFPVDLNIIGGAFESQLGPVECQAR